MASDLYCVTCKGKVTKRVSYLYEAEQKGFLCKKCWYDKYDSKLTKVE